MAGPPNPSHASAEGSSRFWKPMYGFAPHRPAAHHRWGAKLLGATMWFWIFYRMKQDGPALIGLRHPWEGHDDHGHGHGHDEGHH